MNRNERIYIPPAPARLPGKRTDKAAVLFWLAWVAVCASLALWLVLR